MIGERYATAGRLAARDRASLSRRWAARPAIAGRERLTQALGQSVLVQLMLAMAFVALAALLYLAQASQASVLQFNIADLQDQQAQLNVQNANLHATAISLESLQRVDTIAIRQLHMTTPDLSTSIWVHPVIPCSGTPCGWSTIRPLNADTVSAERQSQPLGWMRRFVALVKSSL
jgi:cell division protein FtsL